jgi:cbb3-type cytochrome oxidase maturation protein
MESLYLLIPISILIVFIALWVFFTASDNGQFDDLVGPGLRVLQDDDKASGEADDPAENKADAATAHKNGPHPK